jgi:hypothetical protein
MLVSFGVKGLYFLLSDNVSFVQHQYPKMAELSTYVALAMFAAFLFTLLVWVSYRLAYKYVAVPPADMVESRQGELPIFDYVLIVVALALLAWFWVDRGDDVVEKLRTGTVLYRNMMPKGEDYQSGDYGVSALFAQLRGGLFYALLSYAVLRRNYALGAIGLAFFALTAITSDGSRFALIGTVIIGPALIYIVHLRRDSHYRLVVTALYGLVFLLPALAALLLLWRTQNALLPGVDFYRSLVTAATDTFDGLDHLINYIYVLPIDWHGTRAMEEFWKFFPRKFWHDKPSIFGELALQEVLYPHTVGGGGRYLFLGHYPLSCVVAAMDFLGPIGFLIHGIGTGAMLAWLDSLLRRRTTFALAVFGYYVTTSYHLIRIGFENYLISAVSPCLLPLALFGAAMYVDKSLSQLSKRGLPADPRARSEAMS